MFERVGGRAGECAPGERRGGAAGRGGGRAAACRCFAQRSVLLRHAHGLWQPTRIHSLLPRETREEWGSGAAAVQAASEAARAGGERARAALQRLRARHLPASRALAALRAELAAEPRERVRAELRARLLEAEGPRGPARALAALGAGVERARALYAHGCVLRAAGLWERLVLTVELAAAVDFPPAPAFPPAPDAAAERRREDAAARREDEACRSGLPLASVWARVERLRAAVHWRPGAGADPQRAPSAAAAAELLRGLRGERAHAALCVALLRLAKVPLLPASERLARAAGPEPRAGEGACAETLAALLRAARRLPPAHPAAPPGAAAARAALAPLLDPPHYFSDDAGYLRWCCALWEACCGWTRGARRLALACWHLRWLHALARLAPPAAARRLRADARAALKRLAPAEPLAFAHFARLEATAAGAAAGRRAARHALRAALRDRAAPPERALFAARVLAELDEPAPARWALCCAALGRDPPPDDRMDADPPPELRQEALRLAAERCARLEAGAGERDEVDEDEDEHEDEDECAAMLPGPGEWAAARVALAPPAERARLLAALLAAGAGGGARGGYREAEACALALAAAGSARRAAARDLLPLFPRNALLALMCSGAGAWAGGDADWAAESERATLASLLPLLLRAPLAADADPAGAPPPRPLPRPARAAGGCRHRRVLQTRRACRGGARRPGGARRARAAARWWRRCAWRRTGPAPTARCWPRSRTSRTTSGCTCGARRGAGRARGRCRTRCWSAACGCTRCRRSCTRRRKCCTRHRWSCTRRWRSCTRHRRSCTRRRKNCTRRRRSYTRRRTIARRCRKKGPRPPTRSIARSLARRPTCVSNGATTRSRVTIDY